MTGWERPRLCEAGACVEVRITADAVEIRDTKQSISPVLTLDLEEWHRTVLANLYADHNGLPDPVARIDTNTYAWCGHDTDGTRHTLWFDHTEWAAFVAAVRAGQHRVPAVAR